MYHAIVRAMVRRTWRRVESGDVDAAVSLAAPNVRFHFVGDTSLGAEVHGPQAFRAWFDKFAAQLPDVRLSLDDVVVAGWPWRTTLAARLRLRGTLDDGSPYENMAFQWAVLRWGKLVDDVVLEDTLKLDGALHQQEQFRRQTKLASQ